MRRAVAITMTTMLVACSADEGHLASTTEAIADGDVVTTGAIAQSTVMFTPAEGDGTHGCSASIIDERHALTAAHCLLGVTVETGLALVFAPAFSRTAPRRLVTDFRTVTGRPGGADDIAVLTFEGGLPAPYEPVALAGASFALRAGDEVIHAGYGQTTLERNDRGRLRAAKTTFVGAGRDKRIRMRGAGSVCSGDSGGPDYVLRGGRLVQIGVHVSGDCDQHASSTDVRAYGSFITSTGATPHVIAR